MNLIYYFLEISNDIQLSHKEWLLNGKEPWSLVEKKWKESLPLRKTYYNNITIENVYILTDEWPSLKLPLGYKLVIHIFFIFP